MMLCIVGLMFTVKNLYLGLNKNRLKTLVKKADSAIEILAKLHDDKYCFIFLMIRIECDC